MRHHELVIIGGGQSALACGYYLRRTAIDYTILDAEPTCGGSWQHAWDSLTLFSPSEHSSLPGWLMPKTKNEFPTREEVIDYLCQYEQRYQLPVERPVEVVDVTNDNDGFRITTTDTTYRAQAIISATGTYRKSFIPDTEGRDKFRGDQLHSAGYRHPDHFKGKKVLVVGEGNSGAQILAEVSRVAETKWATRKEPEFLPDDVDGRVLFDRASAKYYAQQKGETVDTSKFNLGNIVMVPPVKEARSRGVLHSSGSFVAMDEDSVVWQDGTRELFDAIIWCTGFGYATDHLSSLVARDERGKVETDGTRAVDMPGLWLVGYGGWTGFASATLIGVGRSAKTTVREVDAFLKAES